MALYGCALVSPIAVSPAKITSFNGFHYPPFSSFPPFVKPFVNSTLTSSFIYRATPIPASYVYPEPIPEFAEVVSFPDVASLSAQFILVLRYVVALINTFRFLQETQKFKEQLSNKLAKHHETFGNDLDSVVDVCSKVIILLICNTIRLKRL